MQTTELQSAHHGGAEAPAIYGISAEFAEEHEVLHAANAAREAGYTKMDAYAPYPVHGLPEAIGFHDIWVPWIVFICGVTGFCLGVSLEVFVAVFDYPMNVGGRPLLSWPAFIPVAYECTILLSAFGATFGMFALNGLPKPYAPIFNAPNFERASQDRFFLCIEATDPKFDVQQVTSFLGGLHAVNVAEVEQ